MELMIHHPAPLNCTILNHTILYFIIPVSYHPNCRRLRGLSPLGVFFNYLMYFWGFRPGDCSVCSSCLLALLLCFLPCCSVKRLCDSSLHEVLYK
uniref:Uncharacterized protein n=1 Tax=Anguilla anguilla TaxID=7936 RepID=A0A0E9RJ59_ANGAN